VALWFIPFELTYTRTKVGRRVLNEVARGRGLTVQRASLISPFAETITTKTFGRRILIAVARAKGLKVVRSSPVLPSTASPAIYGFHPHGRCPLDIHAYLASSQDTASLLMAGSTIGRYLPSIEVPMALYANNIDATKSELLKELQQNRHIGLFPGGASEMHECFPGSDTITIVKHEGFLRLARVANAEVVPCFIFGMNDSFDSPLKTLQSKIYNYTKCCFPVWFPTLFKTKAAVSYP